MPKLEHSVIITKGCRVDTRKLPIISSNSNLKYFKSELTEDEIIDLLSDVKHRIFPRPFERLSGVRGRKDVVGVEIGVGGGEHAYSLLKNLDIEHLYLIDPYELYEDYYEGKARYGVDQRPLDSTEVEAKKLLKPYSDKITWIKKMSSDAIADIDEEMDFVYIDGNHDEKFVRDDIRNYFPLLKKSGVLGGHDFYNGFQREHDGVILAVIDFLRTHRLQLRVELPDWWIED